jgi:deoxyxylulose-5-phosphate synthase
VGGLGAPIGMELARARLGVTVQNLSIPDCWADAGSVSYIRERMHVDAESVARAVLRA